MGASGCSRQLRVVRPAGLVGFPILMPYLSMPATMFVSALSPPTPSVTKPLHPGSAGIGSMALAAPLKPIAASNNLLQDLAFTNALPQLVDAARTVPMSAFQPAWRRLICLQARPTPPWLPYRSRQPGRPPLQP